MMLRFPGHETVSMKSPYVWCPSSPSKPVRITVPERTMADVMTGRESGVPFCSACNQVAVPMTGAKMLVSA